jgi:hypothetical protein
MNLAPFIEELASLLASKLGAAQAPPVPPMVSKLDPFKAYDAKEVAELLGLTPAAVYAIPEDRLQRVYTGSTGTAVRFLGIHILYHLAGRRGPSMEELASSMASTVSSSRPSAPVRPLKSVQQTGTNGRIRIL